MEEEEEQKSGFSTTLLTFEPNALLTIGWFFHQSVQLSYYRNITQNWVLSDEATPERIMNTIASCPVISQEKDYRPPHTRAWKFFKISESTTFTFFYKKNISIKDNTLILNPTSLGSMHGSRKQRVTGRHPIESWLVTVLPKQLTKRSVEGVKNRLMYPCLIQREKCKMTF